MGVRISVIIPVYNNERWLRACMDSIVSQSYRDIEIILADDGSTDNSLSVCRAYAKEDERITVLSIPHAGPSAARNACMDAAGGEVVVFADADDVLEAGILQAIADQWTKGERRLLCFRYSLLREEGPEPVPGICEASVRREEIFAAVIGGYRKPGHLEGIFRSVWGKAFDRKLIETRHLRFQEGLLLGEDAVFLLEYLQWVDGVRMIDVVGYQYRILPDSVSRQYMTGAVDQYLLQSRLILQALEKSGVHGQETDAAFSLFLWQSFRCIVCGAEKGIRAGRISRKDARAGAKRYYDFMGPYNCRKLPVPWAGRSFRLQNRIGAGVPFAVQYAATRIYCRLRQNGWHCILPAASE